MTLRRAIVVNYNRSYYGGPWEGNDYLNFE